MRSKISAAVIGAALTCGIVAGACAAPGEPSVSDRADGGWHVASRPVVGHLAWHKEGRPDGPRLILDEDSAALYLRAAE
jgi:hypothetical protein